MADTSALPATFNQQGALGGLFAPYYVAGNQQTADANTAWQQGRFGNATNAQLEQARGPAPPASTSGTPGAYGMNVAGTQQWYGGGKMDPDALRAAAWNLPYTPSGGAKPSGGGGVDPNAGRNAVASSIMGMVYQPPVMGSGSAMDGPQVMTNSPSGAQVQGSWQPVSSYWPYAPGQTPWWGTGAMPSQ